MTIRSTAGAPSPNHPWNSLPTRACIACAVSVSTAIVRPRRSANVPLVTAKSMVRARPIGSTPCTVAVAPSRLANIVLCLTPVAASTPPMRPMAASCPA